MHLVIYLTYFKALILIVSYNEDNLLDVGDINLNWLECSYIKGLIAVEFQ